MVDAELTCAALETFTFCGKRGFKNSSLKWVLSVKDEPPGHGAASRVCGRADHTADSRLQAAAWSGKEL